MCRFLYGLGSLVGILTKLRVGDSHVEYGHSHEIARCCKNRLRSAPKVPEDDRKKLKSLADLLEKCCVSLKDIGQTSSLDLMHVLMSVINKLPLDLKRAWIEFPVKSKV